MRRRIALTWCALLGVAALTTAAVVVDTDEVAIGFTPPPGHDLVVAGSAEPGWEPSEADWDQGRPTAYVVAAGSADVGPGGSLHLRLAARHGAEDVAARVRLEVDDPDDQGARTDPATGTRVELFDQLHVVVADAASGEVLVDAGPGSDRATRTHLWDEPWEHGETRVLDVTVSVPVGLGDAWQGAATGLRFHFVSESA